MGITRIMAAHIANTLAKVARRLALRVRNLMEARKRGIEQDRKFYRELRAYCRANNLSPVCEDDWRTMVRDKDDDIRSANRAARQV
jgi:hypothetical protein